MLKLSGLLGAVLVLAASPCLAAPTSLAVTWPQATSDVKPDPNAVYGRLPNGLTYVIYKNATPPGTVSVRLRINAGSLMERDNERGLAHFVEHMAFNGSTHIPGDQLVPLLQRHGMRFGPDAGAFTFPEKTTFILDTPRADAETVDTALFVMREMVGNATFDAAAIERERPVILGEERLRQTPARSDNDDWQAVAYAGQAYATRGVVGGLADTIRTASRDDLLGVYHALYRPETTTLIIVGDVDPADIEARIKAQFGDWAAVGAPRTVDYGAYRAKGLKTFSKVRQAIPDTITASWFRPWNGAVRNAADSDDRLIDTMLVAILDRRLGFAGEGESGGLIQADVYAEDVPYTAETTRLYVTPAPGKGDHALARTLDVVRQFTEYGPTQDELDRELKTYAGFYRSEAAAARTRKSETIADAYIASLDNHAVFASPQQDLEWYQGFRTRVTLDRLKVRAKRLFSGDGPLLSHTGETLGGYADKELAATWRTAQAAAVRPYESDDVKAWAYDDFGPAQPVVSQQDFPQVGFTRYSFANGVTLNLMATQFRDDEVQVSIAFRGGMTRFAPDTDEPVLLAAAYGAYGGVYAGGTGKMGQAQIKRSLAGQTVGVDYNLDDDAATLGFTTNRADLATELQLLSAYASDPAWVPVFYDDFQSALPSLFQGFQSTPSTLVGIYYNALAHGGDHRYVFPDLATARTVKFDAVKNVIARSLFNTPIEVTIVGDIDPAETLKLAQLTIANLPITPSKPRAAPGGDTVSFPATDLDHTYYHTGRADQSVSLLAWPLPDFSANVRETRALRILTEILNTRLYDEVRQRLGQAYDVSAERDQSRIYPGYGVLTVSGSVTAGQDEAFKQAVFAIVADLQAHPVSQDELDRARKPLLDKRDTSRKSNDYWLALIPPMARDAKWIAVEQSEVPDLMAATPEVIMDLARRYLVPEKALHIKVVPEPVKP